MSQKIVTPPISLYVHIPWCQRKCPYCDFNSHEYQGNLRITDLQSRYLQALIQDIAWQLPFVQGREIQSVFFGGGTPSLFSADFYHRFLDHVATVLPCATDMEVTLEANPGTVQRGQLRNLYLRGINRLSLGIQSFSDPLLKVIGRIHTAQEAIQAVHGAQDAGFKRINLDLMYGLPGQNLFQSLSDVRTAIGLAPEHLSWYQLTLEPNTVFYREQPVLPDADTVELMDSEGKALLAAEGYQQYEVSAYTNAEPCRHNCGYWEFADYLGIGAGAHAKVTLDQQHIYRYQQSRIPEDYMVAMQHRRFPQRVPVAPADQAQEFFMNVLRLKQGVPKEYAGRTALDVTRLLHSLSTVDPDLLHLETDRWVCSPRGYNFLNRILMQLSDGKEVG